MSEIARLRQQLEEECEAMRMALYGYATVASHQVIQRRYEALDTYQTELAKHIGEAAATQIVQEVYEKVTG